MGAGAGTTRIQYSTGSTYSGVFVDNSRIVGTVAPGSMVSVSSFSRHRHHKPAQYSMQDMDMQPVEAATSAETSFTPLNQLDYPSGRTVSSTTACSSTLVASDRAPKEEKVIVYAVC